MILEQFNVHMQNRKKKNLDTNLTYFIKINSGGMNEKPKGKVQNYNTGEILCNFGFDEFLETRLKA